LGERRCDTLVVDEALDFEGDCFEAARLFRRQGADILWREEPNQNLRGADPVGLRDSGFIGYHSRLNYSSPARIAEFVSGALPEYPVACANGLPGLGVGDKMTRATVRLDVVCRARNPVAAERFLRHA